MIQSINPFSGKRLHTWEEQNASSIDQSLSKAAAAQREWKELSFSDRAVYLQRLARYLKENAASLGKVATDEMGKPIAEAVAEVEKCALVLDHYALTAADYLQNEEVVTANKKSYITYCPLGVILAVMPWNFPYWQVFRAFAPIVMAGNTMVLKHASNVYGCAEGIVQAVKACGFPEGVLELLTVKSSAVAEVIEDSRIAAVTLTGSSAAGSAVAATAGRVLKKQVLELGGSDPYLILKDADIELAADLCAQSRLLNTGQSCIAAKRFIVESAVYSQFIEALKARFSEYTFGDPLDKNNKIGVLARVDLRDELHEQVVSSIAKGAVLQCGGYIPKGNGAAYPPTILTNVSKGMPAFDEELFGPVASVICAHDESEAISIANNSIYGLGGAVFSKNTEHAEWIAATKIDTGTICVNDFVKSNPLLPFGGIKQSGYGRELAHLGIREFCNIKTVVINR